MEKIILSHGDLKFTTYHYGGDVADAPVVLCLHGFPDNANSFRHQIDDLMAAGYQVLTPTMRGYEPSSIPQDNNFSVYAMAQDVTAWLDQLDITRAHLVGHDWGSAIAYTAAAMAPDRFFSLTTIAVPHPSRFNMEGMKKVPAQALKSWYMLFNQRDPSDLERPNADSSFNLQTIEFKIEHPDRRGQLIMDASNIVDQAAKLADTAAELAEKAGHLANSATQMVVGSAPAAESGDFLSLFTIFVLACFIGFTLFGASHRRCTHR